MEPKSRFWIYFGGLAHCLGMDNLLFTSYSQHKNLVNLTNQQEAAAKLRTQTPATSEQAGTLYVRDNFYPNENGGPSHGETVGASARRVGFKGPIVSHQQAAQFIAGYQRADSALDTLKSQQLDKLTAQKMIATSAEGEMTGTIDSQSSYLDSMTKAGVKNSVVNLSWGTSKAGVAHMLYQRAADAWSDPDPKVHVPAQNLMANYAQAYDLTADKLMSPDSKISGPEREKLQNHLLYHVSAVADQDRNVSLSKKNWTRAVKEFEGNRNSVVLSAGNDGGAAPQEFQKNLLETDDVTSVGATRWWEQDGLLVEKQAKYSSLSGGVDIYASGSMDVSQGNKADAWGTSFAAPKVASTMAELHRQNPTFSSDQVEALMKRKFTHNLTTSQANVEVLDFRKTYDFLQNSTY